MPESAGSSIYALRTATTDFRGKTITPTLDRMDRLATKALPAVPPGVAPATIEYTYTPVGRLDHVATVQYAAAVRTTYYAYDSLGRLQTKDAPEGVVAYRYGPRNEVLAISGFRRSAAPAPVPAPDSPVLDLQLQDGFSAGGMTSAAQVDNGGSSGGPAPDVELDYTYDNLGRLQTVTDIALAPPNATTYNYDAVGNLDHFTYPNGVKHAYTYDARNRLRTLAVTANNGTSLRSYAYDLDPASHRTAVTEAGRRKVTYEYDKNYVSRGAVPPHGA